MDDLHGGRLARLGVRTLGEELRPGASELVGVGPELDERVESSLRQAALWEEVRTALVAGSAIREPEAACELGEEERFGEAYLARGRLGQGAFRVLVTDAYQRRCAVTGERTLPVLEAAHIKPYAESGPHRVSNGILLRSDLHKLFDLGYVTVTPDLRLEVSRRLKAEWENGREYYAYHGRELQVRPSNPSSLPGAEYLSWHNEQRFKA